MISQGSPTKSPQTDEQNQTVDYLKKRGRLELWTGLIGIRSLERADKEQMLNREAESAFVRRNVWGETPEKAKVMNDTYLGDVTHHIQQAAPAAGNLIKGLIGAGLMTTGIGLPAGAWMLADAIRQKPPAVVAPADPSPPATDNDTLFELHLGKPE